MRKEKIVTITKIADAYQKSGDSLKGYRTRMQNKAYDTLLAARACEVNGRYQTAEKIKIKGRQEIHELGRELRSQLEYHAQGINISPLEADVY